MKIECTPQELKELLQKETPVAATTDVDEICNTISERLSEICQSYQTTSCDSLSKVR